MLELAMNHIVEVALGSLIGGSFYRAITIACDNTCAPNVQEINPEPEENKIEERDVSDNESIHTRVIPGYDVGTECLIHIDITITKDLSNLRESIFKLFQNKFNILIMFIHVFN
jgi:hypothetical protein